MEFAIISDVDQLRRALRLRDAIRTAHEAEIVDAADFKQRIPRLAPHCLLLFLGDHEPARFLHPLVDITWEFRGISFGTHGRKAVIKVDPRVVTAEPEAQLAAVATELTQLELRINREVKRTGAPPSSGASIAHWFFEGNAGDEEETDVVALDLDDTSVLVTSAWDLGCLSFLYRGFDDFVSSSPSG